MALEQTGKSVRQHIHEFAGKMELQRRYVQDLRLACREGDDKASQCHDHARHLVMRRCNTKEHPSRNAQAPAAPFQKEVEILVNSGSTRSTIDSIAFATLALQLVILRDS